MGYRTFPILPSRTARLVFFALTILLGLGWISQSWAGPIPTNKPAAYPAWWFERDVVKRLDSNNANPVWSSSYPTADDYAVANTGQLKLIATQACAELQARLPASVWSTPKGQALSTLVTSWNPAQGDAYTVINQGQLKAVSAMFYDILKDVGYATTYPWQNSPNQPDHYAVANLGQLKRVFSFDLSQFVTVPIDSDNDGLSDTWELSLVNASLYDSILSIADISPTGNFDGDSLTNLEEYTAGLNPLDAQDAPAKIENFSGDEATLPLSSVYSQLKVKLIKFGTNLPLVGREVRVQTVKGEGLVRLAGSLDGFSTLFTANSDAQGLVAVEFQSSPVEGDETDISFETFGTAPLLARLYNKGWLGLWDINDSGATTLADSSGFDRSLESQNITWTTRGSKPAVHFTAANKSQLVLDQSNEPVDLGGGSFTVMGWIKTSQLVRARLIGQGYFNAVPGFAIDLGIGGGGKISAALGLPNDIAQGIRFTTLNSFANGQWHHVALVVDRSTGTAAIWMDGMRQSVIVGFDPVNSGGTPVQVVSLSNTIKVAGGTDFLLGNSSVGNTPYDGDLDEVKLYRGALSDAEIVSYATVPAVGTDSDGDGIPDSWEHQIVAADTSDAITNVAGVLPTDDYDDDGISNMDEYRRGTSPIDFYNGKQPSIVILSGNYQTGTAGTVLPKALLVTVTDSAGTTLIKAPLKITAQETQARVGPSGTNLQPSYTTRANGGVSNIYIKP